MPNVSYEKIESIFEEKLRETIQPLTKQVEEAMKNINFISQKYDEIAKLLKTSDEERKLLVTENKNLKIKVAQSENEIKLLQESLNDLDQYIRRDCIEIRGLPMDSKQNSNNFVLKVAEKIGVDLEERNISVSHILPKSRDLVAQSRQNLDCEQSLLSPGSDTPTRGLRRERKGGTADNTGRNEIRPLFATVKLTLPLH